MAFARDLFYRLPFQSSDESPVMESKTKAHGPGCELLLGAFAHVDDIRSSATNLMDTTEPEQVTIIDSFIKSRGLRHCPEKCAVLSSTKQPVTFIIAVRKTHLQVQKSAKCFGVWWILHPQTENS